MRSSLKVIKYFAISCSRYEVNFQEGLSCGGAYVKLLSQSDKLKLVGISVVFVDG